jgi:hypothetical protein
MRTLEYQRGAENMSKTTSQRAKIKAALKAHIRITGSFAYAYCGGCTRLPARIINLKKEGMVIYDRYINVLNRYGDKVLVKEYWL